MSRPLTTDEWAAELAGFARTAFRVELQPHYATDEESELWDRWLAGDRTPPTDVPAVRDWLDQIAAQVAAGKRIERVRVQQDPPTEYQRWQRWFGRWNAEAGEQIRYMTVQRAHEVGLLPAAGPDDWWLLDEQRLIVTRFDADGRLIGSELDTDPQRVKQACAWRDLATHHSAPGRTRGQAA